MNTIRSGFMGAYTGMFGAVVAAALMQRNLVPALIWLAVLVLVLIYGREKHDRSE